MKKTKNVYNIYPAWEFDREVRDLEEQSRNGWHLVKGGLFHCKFAFDDNVQYRYALDFNHSIDDPVRYRATFAEQGWEFINSTFNGWHYFRKVYDQSLPEEEYQIYTDTASQQEMANRWRRIAYALGGTELVLGALLIIGNFRHPAIHSICMALGAVLLGLLLTLGAKWIGRSYRRKASGWSLLPVLGLFSVSLVFMGLRTGSLRTTTQYVVPEDDSAWQYRFEVRLPDIYTLDISVDAEAPVSVSLAKGSHDDGSPDWSYDALPCYFEAEGTQMEQTVHMFLTPGTYLIYTKYLPGAKPDQSGMFRYELN